MRISDCSSVVCSSALIDRYIMRMRAKIAPARRHPYLLVSHHGGLTWGKPLSISALNSQIFARMRAVDPAFAEIHPHAFRHHFNYELSVSIDQNNAKIWSEAAGRSEERREGKELRSTCRSRWSP